MTRASIDPWWRLDRAAFGRISLSATGLASSPFGAGAAVSTGAGRATYFGVSAGASAGAGPSLGCSAAVTSSFDATVRPLLTPAWAVADTRTMAAIRTSLRI